MFALLASRKRLTFCSGDSTGGVESCLMDNKYQIPKKKKPETKQEIIQEEIEQLIKRRDKSDDLAEKQKLNVEITRLFAQYERLKL